MTIKVGDKLPSGNFNIMTDDGPASILLMNYVAIKKLFYLLCQERLHLVARLIIYQAILI